jgi:hypothetical protein
MISTISPASSIVRVETTTPSLRKSTVEPLILSITPLRNSTLLIDSGAPEPLKNNAWRINREIADSSGAFTTGDEIKVTLLLNESVTLAKVGSNKIIVANKEFLLTGTNGTTTDTLEFVYTVKINDNISAENFDIDSKEAIVLSDVKDVDGNS